MGRLVIEAGKAERHYWADLWKYRELLYFLSWRDILVRYKQTVIGLLWAVIRPVLTTIVFVIVFSHIAKLHSDVPYVMLVFAAMLPWQFFASALTESSNSLVGNANMISKIYFPRLIMPASSIVVALTDFLISCVLLLGLMAWYHIVPTWRFLFLIPFTGLAFFAALGAGLWFAALNVEYRDFRYVVPFIVQFGLFISPVPYSTSEAPAQWRAWYSLNPMVGIIDGFRWSIFGRAEFFNPLAFLISVLVVFLVTVAGIWYFRKTERAFADVI